MVSPRYEALRYHHGQLRLQAHHLRRASLTQYTTKLSGIEYKWLRFIKTCRHRRSWWKPNGIHVSMNIWCTAHDLYIALFISRNIRDSPCVVNLTYRQFITSGCFSHETTLTITAPSYFFFRSVISSTPPSRRFMRSTNSSTDTFTSVSSFIVLLEANFHLFFLHTAIAQTLCVLFKDKLDIAKCIFGKLIYRNPFERSISPGSLLCTSPPHE